MTKINLLRLASLMANRLGSLFVLFSFGVYMILYVFFDENNFTKNSIKYYFLDNEIKKEFNKLLISPIGVPIYSRGDPDHIHQTVDMFFCTKLNEDNIKDRILKIGYIYNGEYFHNKNYTSSIKFVNVEKNSFSTCIKMIVEGK